jgi:acetyltransferase-like isoleucine patch superfamily enzyme
VIARARIEIGADCLFGSNVGIYDHEHAFDDASRPIYQQAHRAAPITIGSNVWVGSNVMITSGVRIGDRVVVGANSVVTTDLESGAVYAGAPARLVRRL